MYWSPRGVGLDLNTILGPNWTDTTASEINNAGDIVGNGSDNGIASAFELLWVPKAGTIDGGTYINSTNHAALAAALHPEHSSYSPHPG